MTLHKNTTFSSGQRVLKSKRGARGFFYPDPNESLLIRKPCDGVPQTGWQQYSGYAAYVVPSDVFSPQDRYSPATPKMVVWVPVSDATKTF